MHLFVANLNDRKAYVIAFICRCTKAHFFIIGLRSNEINAICDWSFHIGLRSNGSNAIFEWFFHIGLRFNEINAICDWSFHI